MSRSTNTTTTSRWCPSPEQLMILEELYRRGLKTPNSSQIQKITSHLSLHGKIQGKNVFYWFQNHKARDRQKLRKKLMMMMHQQQEDADMYLHQQTLHHHRTYYINNPFNHLPTNYYYRAQKNLHYPQCTAALDKEGHAGLMRRTWSSSDVQKDCFNTITSCGHDDPVRINYMDVGPTAPNASLSTCFINNNKDRPLQTLELFPLTSSSSSSDTKESKS